MTSIPDPARAGSGIDRASNPVGSPAAARAVGQRPVDDPGTSLPAEWYGRSPLLMDLLALALAVLVPAVVIGIHGIRGSNPAPDAATTIAGLVLAAPLVFLRRRWPVPLLAIGVVLSVVLIVATGDRTPVLIAVVILLFTVASRSDRQTALLAGAASAVVLYGAAAIWLDGTVIGPNGLAAVAWSLLAVAAGDAVRSRRAYVAAVEERARRAEATREEEARRRVVEERLRIARELHDVVAHRMAVITVQAAAAGHLLRSDPEQAGASLEHVRSSAATVLEELSGLLHVLRTDDESGTEGPVPTDPVPRLTSLDDPADPTGLQRLVGTFGPVGLQVAMRVETGAETDEASGPGSSGDALPEWVGVVAYRIVQEALTNAHRHGTGAASLVVRRTPGELRVLVTNPVREPVGTTGPVGTGVGAGLGLVGMRERVEAIGGTLTVGIQATATTAPATAARGDEAHWVVDARLPLLPARPLGRGGSP